MLDEKCAERRAENRRHTKGARQIALDARPFGGGVDVSDNRGGDRLDGSGTGPLERAKENQGTHPPGQAAQ